MKFPLPLTPNCMPKSNTQYPQRQISDLDLGVGEYIIAAEGIRIKDKVTLEGGSKDRVIFGASFCSSPSSCSIVEAPMTPLICRENVRGKASSLTPLTDISCHSCSKGEFDGGCFDEWSDKVEAAKPCSSAETPEHSTFDPFADGPEKLVFAPKKPYKTKKILDDDNGDDDDDGHILFDKRSGPKKACEGAGSRASVARSLCFDECLDAEVENHSLDPNDGIACSLARNNQYGSHFSQALIMGEEAHLKRQHKISYAAPLKKLDQTKAAQVSTENVPSGSKSRVVRALDMDYGKHSASEEHCIKDLVGGDDKPLNSITEDALLEETFVEAMCGSFLQAILSKQYEDANTNCTQGHNEENVLSSGQDKSRPSTPVTYPAFSSAADACPGAPMKARTKLTVRGTGLGSVCRKLEF